MERQLEVILFLFPLFLVAGFVSPFGLFFDILGNPFSFASSPAPSPAVVTGVGYAGEWEVVCPNSGVSAMHMVLMHTNKVVIFDATNSGPSNISLPANNCRPDPWGKPIQDCWAHAVEYDVETAKIRPLKVLTNTWCSSGAFAADGTLVQTGGWLDGGKVVRYLGACDTCDWIEYNASLSGERWYSTQQVLPDGRFIIVGGRRQFGYEFVPKPGESNTAATLLQILYDTTDEVEDNLYPFVHLSPDGNLFILSNNRSILFDYNGNKIVREFPVLNGGSRNYPAIGSSVLLPLNLRRKHRNGGFPAEVLVCGGTPPLSAKLAGNGTFLPALRSCGRIAITNPNSKWHMEYMPIPRVMGDMLLLPNAEVLLINGASKGAAGWGFARNPVLNPVLYSPNKARSKRFRILNPTTIPRVYHSTSAVLPDGRILVGGSNSNDQYRFTGTLFPTELRLEKFSPPYLDPQLQVSRPAITDGGVPGNLTYGGSFTVEFGMVNIVLDNAQLMVTMYAPPFTTHNFSMNQRLLQLTVTNVEVAGVGSYKLTVMAPPSSVIAPSGYYMLFVVHQGVPSKGVWVNIH